MTEFEKRVEAGARALACSMWGVDRWNEETSESRALWKKAVRAILAVTEPMHAEELAKIAEGVFRRGSAHTYASENADIYIAQEDACERIATALREAGKE